MKKILLLVGLLLIIFNSNAQIPVGNFTINGKTFVAFISRNLFDDGTLAAPNHLIIQLVGGNMNVLNPSPIAVTRECSLSVFYSIKSHKNDFVTYHNIMRSVFSPARITAIMAHDGEGIMSVVFNIYPNGVIEDIKFLLHRNTIVTPQEIELLYSRMKTQLVFNTSPVGCPNAPRFYIEVSTDELEKLYTDPCYFGNGPDWED